jgi:hypothetical protein
MPMWNGMGMGMAHGNDMPVGMGTEEACERSSGRGTLSFHLKRPHTDPLQYTLKDYAA